ncbi:MmpS family transport accessory protein [Streptomyces ficellus]|uniref:MmpS family transport accessory protein n=1 Tax=Streptomyces ficellus TaxID=1977088 RepID=A0ABT7ZB24_9ACTN|nr:MmpS family transport accessory protein [Streptomyces ficellus]MDN3296706.1 MmpS family transport accessory protein [Streptomyces ficellus]
MNRISRSIASALVAGGLALGLGACSQITDEATKQVEKEVNEQYEVTYEVTGKGVDSIDYHVDGGEPAKPKIETVQKPTLPWKKTVKLRGILPPGVIPVAADATGAEVACKIIYQGKVIEEKSGKGLAAAAGCIAVSPVAG